VHSYYHLVPLVLSYFSVGYLSDVGVFPRILSADVETLGYTHGRVVRAYYLQRSSTPCTEVWYPQE
jgi:hypothetical protein